MALPLDNCAEGGSQGTTVTTSNSGGASFDPFDEAVIGANMAMIFDNAHPAHGGLGYKLSLTSTATAITYLGWTSTSLGAAVATLYGRFYLYSNKVPATSTVRMLGFYNGSTLAGYLGGIQSGLGSMQFRSSANAAIGTASANLSVNTLYRIEFTVTGGASGSGTAKVYAGDSLTTIGADASFSAISFGTTFDHVRLGFCTANFSSTSGDAIWVDDLNVNVVGYPGIGPTNRDITRRSMPLMSGKRS